MDMPMLFAPSDFLDRNQEKQTDLREFLTHHIHNPKRRIALAAIDSLGQLGDPRVIATLEKFTNNAEGGFQP